jgi:hypothetical protein
MEIQEEGEERGESERRAGVPVVCRSYTIPCL